jgi:hypothetical protein
MNEELYSNITIDEKQKMVVVHFMNFETIEDCESFVKDLSQFFSFAMVQHNVQNQTIH